MILLFYRNPGPEPLMTNSLLEQTGLIWGDGAPADGQLGNEGGWGRTENRHIDHTCNHMYRICQKMPQVSEK